jgi:lysine biosynthesis protein LysW
MAKCPECNAKLTVTRKLSRSDHIFCRECKAELEVVALEPLELEAIYDFEDDSDVLNDLEEDFEDVAWDHEASEEDFDEDSDASWG